MANLTAAEAHTPEPSRPGNYQVFPSSHGALVLPHACRRRSVASSWTPDPGAGAHLSVSFGFKVDEVRLGDDGFAAENSARQVSRTKSSS